MSKYKNVFPNNPVDDIGSYEYHSQTITLHKVKPARYDLAYKQNDPSARFLVLPVAAHEVAHWVDHTATLWGQQMLVRMFNTFNIRAQNDEHRFFEILDYERTSNRIRFPDYYSTIEEGASDPWDGIPWLYRFTCGLMFGRDGKLSEDHPVVFTRFDNHQDRGVCRVPFSVTTLLEVNAVAAELSEARSLIEQLNVDKTRRDEELAILSKQMLNHLYDPIFAVYSAAAHCFANRVPTRFAAHAYQRAAKVARLCLNVPDYLFNSVKSPEICKAKWGNRVTSLKRLRDRGFLFFCLVENGAGFDCTDVDCWLELTLKESSLPPVAEILKKAREEMIALRQTARTGPAKARLDELLDYGLRCFDRFGLTVDPSLYEGGDLMPPFKLSDGNFVPGGSGMRSGSFADPALWESEADCYQNQVQEFVDACLL